MTIFFENTILQSLKKNRETVSKFLNPNYPLEIIHVSKNDENFLELDLQNNFYFPINLHSLNINGKIYQINKVVNPKKISLNSLFEGSYFQILKKPKRSKIRVKILKDNEFSKDIKINYSIGNSELKTFTISDFNPVELKLNLVSNIENLNDQLNINKILKKITPINNKLTINKNLFFQKIINSK